MNDFNKTPEYRCDQHGYVDWVSVSHGEFGQSMYTTAPYIHGRKHEGIPALGIGLRFAGDAEGYPHTARIHKDDIPELTQRVTLFKTIRDGFVRDDEGQLRPLTPGEVEDGIRHLTATGISEDEVSDAILESRRSTLNYPMLNLSWILQQ